MNDATRQQSNHAEHKPLILESTPTKFGKVNIELTKNGEGYSLKLSRVPGFYEPDQIILHWHGSAAGSAVKATNKQGVWELALDGQEPCTIALSGESAAV